MTIDESLEWLIPRKEHYEMDDGCQELAQALDMSIDIMRKYQKITELVEEWGNDLIDYEGHYGDDYMEKIEEVIEDGNDV